MISELQPPSEPEEKNAEPIPDNMVRDFILQWLYQEDQPRDEAAPAKIDGQLTLEERAKAKEFKDRLTEADKRNTLAVIKAVYFLEKEYLNSEEPQKTLDYSWQFYLDTREGKWSPFFAVYGIGGYVTKEGERPDVDLLVATNMRYRNGPTKRYDDPEDLVDPDPFLRKLQETTRGRMQIELMGIVPDNYNLGITYGKVIARLTPLIGGKSIDVVYVRSMMAGIPACFESPTEEEEFKQRPEYHRGHYLEHYFDSRNEFEQKDNGPEGKPLPRVILFSRQLVGLHPTPLVWHW